MTTKQIDTLATMQNDGWFWISDVDSKQLVLAKNNYVAVVDTLGFATVTRMRK